MSRNKPKDPFYVELDRRQRDSFLDAVCSIRRFNCVCGKWIILPPGKTVTCSCGLVHKGAER